MRYILALLVFAQTFVACQSGTENMEPLAAAFGIASNPTTSSQPGMEKTTPSAANIVFQSTDGGQSWQDVSAGLPSGIQVWGIYASGVEVLLSTENNLYRSQAVSAPMMWTDESVGKSFPLERIEDVFPAEAGLYAFSVRQGLFENINGLGLWVPVFDDLKGELIRSVFETSEGAILVGCNNGIFKSDDDGKTWKKVFAKEIVTHLVEKEGTLFASSRAGLVRSTDGGGQWEPVLGQNSFVFRIEPIKGGIVATVQIEGAASGEDRGKDFIGKLLFSADQGQTWQEINGNLPPAHFIFDIKQVDNHLFCSIEAGIFRSADQGKTWELVFPSDSKTFQLAVSGKVVFAVLGNAGC